MPRSAKCLWASAPTTSGLGTELSETCSTGCWVAWGWSVSRPAWTRRWPACRAASAGGSPWRACCWNRPSCCCLTSPPTTWTWQAWIGFARHLAARRGAMLVVTHDRWFLDAVCTATWEVDNGAVHQYEGGYAAYVLARAERDRQAAAKAGRGEQLWGRELVWLRRGPPASTTKPKFRIEAAEALIADEPQARDRVELARFASARLGNKVVDAVNVSLTLGEREILKNVTWQLGPGDRVALVGINGSGKTTLMRLLAGELEPTKGGVERGETVKLAHLSQDATEIPGNLRVLESLEEVRSHAVLSDGRELPAGPYAALDGWPECVAAGRAHQRPGHRHTDLL